MSTPPPARLYSQHGEDAIILEAFAGQGGARGSGFFVEVGCIDGRRFSNTLALEEAGWRGICIEAHEGYIDLLRRNRPNSTVIHAAVAEADAAAVEFFANSRGSLSTLDRSLEADYAQRYGRFFTGFETQRVPMRCLSSILDELDAPPVDVLSVDVEGCDSRVIRGLDLARHRPALIVVEADNPAEAADIDATLTGAGYLPGPVISSNHFYLLDRARLARITGRRFECEVTHTQHPLDAGGDEVRTCTHQT